MQNQHLQGSQLEIMSAKELNTNWQTVENKKGREAVQK